MGIFCPDKLFTPGAGVLGSDKGWCPRLGLNAPLTAGLWVITRGQAGRGSQEQIKSLPELRHKLGAPVGDNIPWHTMETKHVLKHYLSCVLD